MPTEPADNSLSPRDLEIQQLLDRACAAAKRSEIRMQLDQIARAEDPLPPAEDGDGGTTCRSHMILIGELGREREALLKALFEHDLSVTYTEDRALETAEMTLKEYVAIMCGSIRAATASIPLSILTWIQPTPVVPGKRSTRRPRPIGQRSTKFPAATLRVGRGFFATTQVYARNAP